MHINPIYSIGIPEMDAQHARWIALIEKFKAIGPERLLDPAGIQAARHTLEQLLDYTRKHFASEEQLFALHGFPGQEAHKRSHREIEAKVQELLDEARQLGSHRTPLKLNLLSTIWLFEHITRDDEEYARFIRTKLGLDKPLNTA